MKEFFFTLTAILAFFSAKAEEKAYRYEVSICAIFKDEAPYLKEWIEFHKLVGVEHFYLINHFSQDSYLEVLQPYIDSNEVELFHSDDNRTDSFGFMYCVQPKEYNKVIAYCKNETKWLAIIDSDEFLFPVIENNLKDFLKDYEEFGGVYVFWQMFGTSYVPYLAEDCLQIEAFTMQSEEDYYYNKWGKSIVRPDRVSESHLHFSNYKEPFFHVFPDKTPIGDYDLLIYDHSTFIPQFNVDVSKVRINHYWTRDEEYVRKVKYPRYQQWNLEKHFEERLEHLNKCPNYKIHKYLDALRKKMFP